MSDLQMLAQFLRNFKKDEFKNLNETRTRYYQDKIAIPELLSFITFLGFF